MPSGITCERLIPPLSHGKLRTLHVRRSSPTLQPFLFGNYFCADELVRPDTPGGAWTEKILHIFDGTDGVGPFARPLRGDDRHLYGTPDSEGGKGSLSVIYSFKGGSDGEIPGGGVVSDRQGRLYGGTANGGNPIFCNSGCGVVFQLTRPSSGSGAWSEETLHEFNGDDGAQAGGLIFGSSGSLYGVTANGGPVSLTCPGDCGSVYQLTPPASPRGKWRQTTLYFFTSAGDGHNPNPGLIRDPGCTVRRYANWRKLDRGWTWRWNCV